MTRLSLTQRCLLRRLLHNEIDYSELNSEEISIYKYLNQLGYASHYDDSDAPSGIAYIFITEAGKAYLSGMLHADFLSYTAIAISVASLIVSIVS